MIHNFDTSTRDAETGRAVWVKASLAYRGNGKSAKAVQIRLCPKKKNNKTNVKNICILNNEMSW